MIKITPKTAPELTQKILKNSNLKQANFYSQLADKLVPSRGYIFGSKNPVINQKSKQEAANKVNEIALCPENCGKVFLEIV